MCTTVPPGLMRMSVASSLFCLADCRALFVSASTCSSPRGLWALGGFCCSLRRLGWAWGQRLPAGSHAPLHCLQESVAFSCRWGSGEISLSGVGLGKQAVWAFWPDLVLSCSGLPTQIKHVSEEPASSTAVRLQHGAKAPANDWGSSVTALVCLSCAHP